MADWWGNTANTGNWWGGGSAPTSGLGPNGGPVARNTYNAKNLPLGDPNVAAENYGVTTDNVADKWGKIWDNRTNKAGGSKEIFDKVSSWASPEKIRERGGNPNDMQWRLINDAIRTGKVDPRLNPETLRRGMGVGLSETARHQQHKPKNFFTSYLLDPLVMGGLSLIPGVGVPLAMGYGGIKGGVEGGPLGAITGLASGYGAGQFTNWLKNGVSAGFGALNDVNPFMPADIAARAGTEALPQAWTLGAGGRAVLRGGKAIANGLRARDRMRSGPPRP